MAALTNQEIVDIVNTEFENAQGMPSGDISEERARALDYYLKKPYGNEEEGSSKVITSDVADVVDGMMPSLLRIFTSADNLVSFDAVGPEDEPGAEQESDFVSYTFFKRNPAFEILFYWLFDALVQKNGYVKAWWDETEEVTTEEYEGLTDDEVAVLMSDDELEPIEREERTGDTVDVQGNVVQGIVHDIKFKRVVKGGQVRIDNVPPDEFRISGDARSLDPSKARMVSHEREVTRDKLLRMGFKKSVVDKLPASDESLNSTEKVARKDKSDDQKNSASANKDKSQDTIVLRETYIDVDVNRDGRSELKQVFTADSKLLEIEDSDRQPFHAICPSPLPHKHFGLSTGEKVMDVQLVTSELLRQVLNNLYRSNQPGHAVWEQGMGENTMDDLLTTEVGRVARFKRPVGESYAPMTVPFTAADTFPMVEYFDKVKRDRTGISSDAEGLTPEALKNIQQSVLVQATDMARMKIEAVARIFAETGFKSLFKHVHELLQKHQQKAEVVKLRGQWVQVNPSEWRNRRDMTVNIGLGIGTREQNLVHLNAIWEKQSEMVQGGGMNLTVTPKNIYNTAAEIVKNANLKLPAMFFTDPGNQPAPPPNDEQAQLQKKEQELEERRQKLDAERNEINQAKLQLENQSQTLQHQRDLMKIEGQREERTIKFEVENNKLRTALAEQGIKLDVAEADALIKRVTAEAQADQLQASAEQALALADKARVESQVMLAEVGKDTTGNDVLAAAESEAKVTKTQLESQEVVAKIEKTQAETDKIRKDTEAVSVEIKAAESGIEEMLDGTEDSE